MFVATGISWYFCRCCCC